MMRARSSLVLVLWLAALLALPGGAAQAERNPKAPKQARQDVSPLRFTIADFHQSGGDPRYRSLSRSLPEAIAMSLLGDTRVAVVDRGELWRVATQVLPLEDLQKNPDLVLDARVLDQLKIDLVLRGEFWEYAGRIRLEARLEDRRTGRSREIAPEVLDARDIYQPVGRVARELNAELSALLSPAAAKRLAVICFRDDSPARSPATARLADELVLSLMSDLDGLAGVTLLSRSETAGACAPGAQAALRDVADRLGADAVLSGSYTVANDRIAISPALYIRTADFRFAFGRTEDALGGDPGLADRLGDDVRSVLEAIIVGGQWSLGPLRFSAPVPGAYVARARRYLGAHGNAALAALMARRALELDGTHAEAYLVLGLARMRQDRAAEGVRALEEAVRLDPARREAWVELGNGRRARGAYAAAATAFGRALALEDSADVRVKLAEVYFLMRKPDAARVELDRALQLDAGSVAALTLRGRTYQADKAYDQAIAAFRDALRLEPGAAAARAALRDVYFARGRERATRREWREALVDFNEVKALRADASIYQWILASHNALMQYPEVVSLADEAIRAKLADAYIYNYKGLALRRLQRHAEAIQAYDEALRLNAGLVFLHNNKGYALAQSGRVAEALTLYDEALRIDRRYVTAYTNKADALVQSGRLDEALRVIDEALALQPDAAPAYRVKGQTLRRLRRYDEAQKAYEEALRLSPRDTLASQGKASALADQGRFAEALAIFEGMIRQEPDGYLGYNGKAYALAELGRYGEAAQVADLVIAKYPRFANSYSHKGFSEYRLGDREGGLRDLQKAIALNPRYAGAHFNLARIYSLEGRTTEAIESLQKALELDDTYRAHAVSAKEFDPLRQAEEFRRIVGAPGG